MNDSLLLESSQRVKFTILEVKTSNFMLRITLLHYLNAEANALPSLLEINMAGMSTR